MSQEPKQHQTNKYKSYIERIMGASLSTASLDTLSQFSSGSSYSSRRRNKKIEELLAQRVKIIQTREEAQEILVQLNQYSFP